MSGMIFSDMPIVRSAWSVQASRATERVRFRLTSTSITNPKTIVIEGRKVLECAFATSYESMLGALE